MIPTPVPDQMEQPDVQASEPKAVPKAARFFAAIPRAVWYVFLGYIGLCIILNVVVAPFIDYRYKWQISSYGWAFLLVAIALGIGLCALVRRVHKPSWSNRFLKARWFGLLVGVGCVVLFIVQLVFVCGAYFTSDGMDWMIMLQLDRPDVHYVYYSIYPNNLFLGGIFAILSAISNGLGLDPLFLCDIGSCLCITTSVALASFVARRIGGAKCGVCAFFLLFVFVGLNENIFVPYSDSYAVCFTVTILFFFVCVQHPVKWPVIVFLTYMGYYVKPTVVAVLGAIILVNGCLWISRRMQGEEGMPSAKRILGMGLACILGLLLSFGSVCAVKSIVGVTTLPNASMTPSHFLKIGLNPDSDGMYNYVDRNSSTGFLTLEDQTEANMLIIRSRLNDMGIDGIIKLLVRKNLNTYNKGELLNPAGNPLYYDEIRGNNVLIQQFYGIYESRSTGNPDSGAIPSPWSYIAQALWFLILVGIVLCSLRKRVAPADLVMGISLLLLSAFLLLFECDSRYLYLYAPFYVLLAVRGWQAASWRIQARKRQSEL